MKFYAPLTAALVFGLAFATTSLAQDTAASAAKQTSASDAAPEAMAAPASAVVSTSDIPADVLNLIGKPEAGKGMVVFFRPSRFAGAAISFKVRENETELGKLKSGSYIIAQVEPGKHTYTVHSEAKDVTNIEVEDGETYFLSGTITMGFMVGRPNLTPSDALKFQAEMKKMKAAL